MVGSRFWSPPLKSKAVILRTLNSSWDCSPHPQNRPAPEPGRFESLELLQERGELLLLRRAQVPQSRLFPERTLRERPATDTETGVSGGGHTARTRPDRQGLPGARTCRPAAETAGAAAAGTRPPQPAPAASSAAPGPCCPDEGQSAPVALITSPCTPAAIHPAPARLPLSLPAPPRGGSAHQQWGW